MANTGKHVIFVGGTSYSGSTLLDMILSSTPGGFSCGEVVAMFHPYRSHHIGHECGCGDKNCTLWDDAMKAGESNLYLSLFDSNPDVSYIVDSSKDPLWIRDRTRDLERQGIQVHNILIWKRPEEFRESREKRGREARWLSAWINYHNVYFCLVKEWYAIAYSDLVQSPDAIQSLCKGLDIPFSEGMERYWEKTHHTLFGNTSAKIHLYDRSSPEYRQCANELTGNEASSEVSRHEENKHRSIYYNKLDGTSDESSQLPAIKHLFDAIRSRDVIRSGAAETSSKAEACQNRLMVNLRVLFWCIRREVRTLALKF